MSAWLPHRTVKLAVTFTGVAAIAFATGFVTIRPLQVYWLRSTQPLTFQPRTNQYAQQVAAASQVAFDNLSIQALPVILQASLPTNGGFAPPRLSDLPGEAALNPLGSPLPNHSGFAGASFVAPPELDHLPRLSTVPPTQAKTGVLVAMQADSIAPVAIDTQSVNALVTQPTMTEPLAELTQTVTTLAMVSEAAAILQPVRYAHLPRL